MSHSLGYGTSSGDLNTGGNLSESSFLEALFGLEFGHADVADDADFSSLLFISPTDFHRFLPYAGWDFADVADFSSLLFDCPTDSTEFCPMRAGISLVTCRFLVISLVVSRKKRIFAAELNV